MEKHNRRKDNLESSLKLIEDLNKEKKKKDDQDKKAKDNLDQYNGFLSNLIKSTPKIIDLFKDKKVEPSILTINNIHCVKDLMESLLDSIKDKALPLCKEFYHSKTINALNLINFNEGDPYIFAYNTGQANFIIIRRENSGIIVDCGRSKSTNLLEKGVPNAFKCIEICNKIISIINKDSETEEIKKQINKLKTKAAKIEQLIRQPLIKLENEEFKKENKDKLNAKIENIRQIILDRIRSNL